MPKTTKESVKTNAKKTAVSSPISKTRTKRLSPILQGCLDTARDFYSIGLIDKMTMREFEVMTLPKVKTYSPRQIKALRKRCQASQAVFAAHLNVTTSSLQKWEVGEKKPNGAALKLLDLVDRKGLEVLL